MTPDEILQARLVRAVSEIDETLASREPDVTMGMIGIGSSGPPPKLRGMRMGATNVSGHLPPEVIQRIVRVNYDRLRQCYERELAKKPDLTGRATTKFVISRSGTVSNAKTTGDLPQSVSSCVQSVFQALKFPEPEAGIVTVSYPIIFSPSTEKDSAPSSSAAPPSAAPPSSPPTTSPSATSASSPPTTVPLPLRPQPLPEPAPSAGPWPIVVVSGSDVMLGTEKVDSTEPVTTSQRLQRVDGAFIAMKQWRDRWRMAHPRARFPGVAGLRVADDAPLLVVKSVFQTMAYAGFPNILVQSGGQPERIVDLSARVPGPPQEVVAPAREPSPVFVVRTDESGLRLTWMQGNAATSEQTLRATDPALATKVCEMWKASGAHRDPKDPMLDHAVLRTGIAAPFADVRAMADAVNGCTRTRQLRDGTSRTGPVFWLTFAMN
ncbi:MAG: AgmX/PglI C-terminal domain-containing protein [Polyangiaceae bacterium]